MFDGLPLKIRVVAEKAPSQLEFALSAARRVMSSDRYRLEAGRTGLVVFAASESDLEEVTQLLREIYADSYPLDFGAPIVCLHRYNGQIYQPVMHVRIRARRTALHLILLDLMDRQARVLEVDHTHADVIVRARAPMLLLIGQLANLRLLTQDVFELCAQLTEYELLQENPAIHLPRWPSSAAGATSAQKTANR